MYTLIPERHDTGVIAKQVRSAYMSVPLNNDLILW